MEAIIINFVVAKQDPEAAFLQTKETMRHIFDEPREKHSARMFYSLLEIVV